MEPIQAYTTAPEGRHRRSWRKRSANGVETEGPHIEEGVTGAQQRDNVVRLPRDWLGPREELVPFGPAAQQSPDDVRPPGPNASAGAEAPVSAAAFWGEESAAVQEPAVTSDEEPVPRGEARRLTEISMPRVMAAAGLVVVVCLAGVLVAGLLGSAGDRAMRAPRGVDVVDTLASKLELGVSTVRRIAGRRMVVPRIAARRPLPDRIRPHQVAAVRPSGVSATVYARPTPTATPSVAPGPQPIVSAQPSTARANSNSHSASTSSQPAFGAHGVLGPGHSPNG